MNKYLSCCCFDIILYILYSYIHTVVYTWYITSGSQYILMIKRNASLHIPGLHITRSKTHQDEV